MKGWEWPFWCNYPSHHAFPQHNKQHPVFGPVRLGRLISGFSISVLACPSVIGSYGIVEEVATACAITGTILNKAP